MRNINVKSLRKMPAVCSNTINQVSGKSGEVDDSIDIVQVGMTTPGPIYELIILQNISVPTFILIPKKVWILHFLWQLTNHVYKTMMTSILFVSGKRMHSQDWEFIIISHS